MANLQKPAESMVGIKVELFGLARMLSGHRTVEIALPASADVVDVAAALGKVCPELVGAVILDDASGLRESYTFNLNGTAFISGERLELKPGDTLLLFSSQAGG